MTDRSSVEATVASALALARDHEDVQTIINLSASFPGKHWDSWPWWTIAKPSVLADEDGFWGVVSVITNRACALARKGQEARQAALDAAHEVGREIRDTYAVIADEYPEGLEVEAPSVVLGIDPGPAVRNLIKNLYSLASPKELEVIALVTERGLDAKQAAEELGISHEAALMRLGRLRQKYVSVYGS